MLQLEPSLWEVPEYELFELNSRKSKYCLCVPVINEGDKLKNQLKRMARVLEKIDVIIADGGSSDGSTDKAYLAKIGVHALLVKTGTGRLSAQLRMAFSYALKQGYQGVITIDGNNKDSVESTFLFVEALDSGYSFVQGSRYIRGGQAINTPMIRNFAIKCIHSPIISLLSGFRYTDTTNGFRGMSRTLLLDSRVNIFRDIFQGYELLGYLSVRAPKLGYKVKEVPVIREYPLRGKVPTKISPWKGNFTLLKILWNLARGRYNPH